MTFASQNQPGKGKNALEPAWRGREYTRTGLGRARMAFTVPELVNYYLYLNAISFGLF